MEAHKISLLTDGSAWIIFDYDGAHYRVAFYFPSTNAQKVTTQRRYPVLKPNLRDALTEAFRINGSPFLGEFREKAEEVERYIRGTQWGASLP